MPLTLDTIRSAVSRPAPSLDLPDTRSAAVAALITPDLQVVLMRRARCAGDPWSGQVSFPGGRAEPGDPDPVATALRETREELGSDVPRSALLGPLAPLPTRGPLPKLVIRPFVFALEDLPSWSPNPTEVASVHTLPLADLLAGRGRGRFVYDRGGLRLPLPCVDFPGGRLWGITLHILDDLLHRLDGRGTGLERPMEGP